MNLGRPPADYDQADQAKVRAEINSADAENIKRGQILDSLLFRDTVTGVVKTVTVASGSLVVT